METGTDLDTDAFFSENTWRKQPQRPPTGSRARSKSNNRKPLAGLSINTTSSPTTPPTTPPTYESRLQAPGAEPSTHMADGISNIRRLRGNGGSEGHSPSTGEILSSGLDKLSSFMLRGSVAVTQAVEKFVERTATDFATTFDMADAIPPPEGHSKPETSTTTPRWDDEADSSIFLADSWEASTSGVAASQKSTNAKPEKEQQKKEEVVLQDELKRMRSRCTALKLENASLRHRLAAERVSEDPMSEQMRAQTELLLKERSQLSEDNRSLMRELAQMHELFDHLDLMGKTASERL